MLFSQRMGQTPIKSVIQSGAMDSDLRISLWNALHICVWDKAAYESGRYGEVKHSNLRFLFSAYWISYLKLPLDTLPDFFTKALEHLRQTFMGAEWFEVYDFLEFTAQSCPKEMSGKLVAISNTFLEKELSAYRFVNGKIVELTTPQEVESIEEAIRDTSQTSNVQAHLQSAISLLADKKSPDYRNCIKEAISAVEALAQSLTGNPRATLGDALNLLEKREALHPALKKSLSSLYSYTSDGDGIRHAMLDEPNLTSTDAIFMLVTCSAFINYMVKKTSQRA